MKAGIGYQAICEKTVEFARTWRTTDSALEALATRHNDTLLILDEMSQVDPNNAGEVAYLLGNSQRRGCGHQECAGNHQAQIDG